MGAERPQRQESVPERPRLIDVERIAKGLRLGAGLVVAYGAMVPMAALEAVAEMREGSGVTRRLCDSAHEKIATVVGWIVGPQG